MQDVLHGTHNVSYILSHTVVFHLFFFFIKWSLTNSGAVREVVRGN